MQDLFLMERMTSWLIRSQQHELDWPAMWDRGRGARGGRDVEAGTDAAVVGVVRGDNGAALELGRVQGAAAEAKVVRVVAVVLELRLGAEGRLDLVLVGAGAVDAKVGNVERVHGGALVHGRE